MRRLLELPRPGKGSFDAYLTLTTPDEEQDPLQHPIIRGTYFNENDVENRSAVCILDKASALYLFGTEDIYGMDLDLQVEDSLLTLQVKRSPGSGSGDDGGQ